MGKRGAEGGLSEPRVELRAAHSQQTSLGSETPARELSPHPVRAEQKSRRGNHMGVWPGKGRDQDRPRPTGDSDPLAQVGRIHRQTQTGPALGTDQGDTQACVSSHGLPTARHPQPTCSAESMTSPGRWVWGPRGALRVGGQVCPGSFISANMAAWPVSTFPSLSGLSGFPEPHPTSCHAMRGTEVCVLA